LKNRVCSGTRPVGGKSRRHKKKGTASIRDRSQREKEVKGEGMTTKRGLFVQGGKGGGILKVLE